MPQLPPLRRIVRRDEYRCTAARKKAGSVRCTLNCGHTIWRKLSATPKRRARCPNCDLRGINAQTALF